MDINLYKSNKLNIFIKDILTNTDKSKHEVFSFDKLVNYILASYFESIDLELLIQSKEWFEEQDLKGINALIASKDKGYGLLIREDKTDNEKIALLFHELGHLVSKHIEEPTKYDDNTKEVVAETIARVLSIYYMGNIEGHIKDYSKNYEALINPTDDQYVLITNDIKNGINILKEIINSHI